MEFPEIDNSPLGISRRENTHRFFQLPLALYIALCAIIDARRGYPLGTTQRGLQDPDELPRAANGDVMVAIDNWRFEPEDNAMIAPYITAGTIKEYTRAQFQALLPASVLP